MTFLPIVARELRVGARRRGVLWHRVAAAGSGIILGTWWFVMNRHETPAQLSVPMFGMMTGCATLYCLLSGVFLTSDCLSSEKREGTLGLLFLTDLRGYDVVIGKLAATSLGALYGVMAVLPILGIPLLIGGLTAGEVGRMALVILNALFLSLAVGLAISAMSRSGAKAVLATFLTLLGLTVGPGVLATILENNGISGGTEILVLLPDPAFTFGFAFDSTYKATGNASAFWWSFGVVHALAWAFLFAAASIARRAWRDRATTLAFDSTTPPTAGLREWARGNPEERRNFREELLDRNPFFWLAARAWRKPAQVWGVLGALALIWLGLWRHYGREDFLIPPIFCTTAWALSCLLKLWFTFETTRQLANEREQGTLELLLSTPLSVESILHGQWLALKRQFLGPCLVVMVLSMAFLALCLRDATAREDRIFALCFYLAGVAGFLGDLAAIYWLGMWRGLVSRNHQRACLGVIGAILILPWVGIALFTLLEVLSPAPDKLEPFFFWACWSFASLVVDVSFGGWAYGCLTTEFRTRAAARFRPDAPRDRPVIAGR